MRYKKKKYNGVFVVSCKLNQMLIQKKFIGDPLYLSVYLYRENVEGWTKLGMSVGY